MTITVYQRTYPVKGAPVSLSFVPFATSQTCTFPVGDRVYEAKYSELQVVVPDGAKVDVLRNRVTWGEGKGRVYSTAKEVVDLARVGDSGFRLAG